MFSHGRILFLFNVKLQSVLCNSFQLCFILIAEAVARILGSSEKIIKSGSTLQLNCILKQTTEEPQYIFW